MEGNPSNCAALGPRPFAIGLYVGDPLKYALPTCVNLPNMVILGHSIFLHLFCKKKQLTTQLYNKTPELVKVQQLKHAITDKIASTNRINS